MGWASWARNAKDLGCRSYGFDLSPERNAFAESHGIETAADGETFHFINTEQVFEHVIDPAALARELGGRLRPGGILKISVPSSRGLLDTFRRLSEGQATVGRDEIMPLQPLEHVNCFSPKGIELLGAEIGLRPVVPSLPTRFAFLPGVSVRHPRKALKELVRPFYQWRNPSNLYVWLRKH
jgi:SAM-dependent methyltransferase